MAPAPRGRRPPTCGSPRRDLLQAADRAMYAAKARGGGTEVAGGVAGDDAGAIAG